MRPAEALPPGMRRRRQTRSTGRDDSLERTRNVSSTPATPATRHRPNLQIDLEQGPAAPAATRCHHLGTPAGHLWDPRQPIHALPTADRTSPERRGHVLQPDLRQPPLGIRTRNPHCGAFRRASARSLHRMPFYECSGWQGCRFGAHRGLWCRVVVILPYCG